MLKRNTSADCLSSKMICRRLNNPNFECICMFVRILRDSGMRKCGVEEARPVAVNASEACHRLSASTSCEKRGIFNTDLHCLANCYSRSTGIDNSRLGLLHCLATPRTGHMDAIACPNTQILFLYWRFILSFSVLRPNQ